MSRPSEGCATAGHDARWPLRAYRVALYLQTNGPRSRESVFAAAIVLGIGKMLAEDTICAMENDGIVEVAGLRHLTLAERRQARGARVVKLPHGLRLSAKGARFLAEHRQDVEAGSCPCEWCTDLAGIRAWVQTQGPDEMRGAMMGALLPALQHAEELPRRHPHRRRMAQLLGRW